MPISEDEAYYLYWSNFPQWGYPEHPPFIAWYLWFARNILNFENLWSSASSWVDVSSIGSIRLLTSVFYGLASIPLWFFGRRMASSPVGGWLIVGIFWLVPNFFGLTIFLSPDSLMVPFLLFGLMSYAMAFHTDMQNESHGECKNEYLKSKKKRNNTFYFAWSSFKWYLLAGVFFGLSFLSKVTAFIPLLGVLGYVLFSKKRRFYLKDISFYISFLIVLILLTPFIFWVYQTDLIFLKQLYSQTSLPFDFENFLIFYKNQVFLFGPMLLVLLPYVLYSAFSNYFSFGSNLKKSDDTSFVFHRVKKVMSATKQLFLNNTILHSLLLSSNISLFVFFFAVVILFRALYLTAYPIAIVLVCASLLWVMWLWLPKFSRRFFFDKNEKIKIENSSKNALEESNAKSTRKCISDDFFSKEGYFFFGCVSLFSLIFLVIKSFYNTLYPNWSVFLICSLLPLYAVFVKERLHDRGFAAQLSFRQFFFLAAYLLAFVLLLSVRGELIDKFPNSLGRVVVFYKYQAFKEEGKNYYETAMDKNLPIAGNNYQIPTFINLYWQPKEQAITVRVGSYHPVLYDLFFSQNHLIGRDFYYVFYRKDKNQSISNLWSMCESVLLVNTFNSYVEPFTVDIVEIFKKHIAEDATLTIEKPKAAMPVGIFDLYRCNNFKGSNFNAF